MNASTHIHRGLSLVASAAAAVSIAACGSEAADKSGASGDRQVALTLEMPDHGDELGTAFANAVARRSRGSVRIEIGRGYDNETPANELRLARALEDGRAEAGYLPARAWSAAGIPAFTALLAPFALTTDDAAQALAYGKLGRDVLATLPGDLVGLALVPAEPRRILAVRSPLTATDFTRLRVRVVDNPQSAAALQALGAQPVEGMRARQAAAALRDSRIDAVESAPAPVLTNAYWNYARYLTGYALFPKFQSIVFNRAAWERLSSKQQAAVREAVADTLRSAKGTVAARERSELQQLCAAGVRIVVPSAQEMKTLVRAVQPAIASLATDKGAARILEAIRALPGAGPQPLATPLPPGCRGRAIDHGSTLTAQATIPNGTYVVKVTAAQFRAAGAQVDTTKEITYTTRIQDGRWTQTQTPTWPDQCADVPTRTHPACTGTYEVDGDQVTFVWTKPTPPPLPAPETVKWSYFDGVLRFKPVAVADPGSRAIYGQPWRKVA